EQLSQELPAEEAVNTAEQLPQSLSVDETVSTPEQLLQELPAGDNIFLNYGPMEEYTVTNPSSIIESESGLTESGSRVNANDDISMITNSSISINYNGPTLDGSTLSVDPTSPSLT